MMKTIITIFSILFMLIFDFLYFKWACENYDPSKGHNCEQCSEIKSERSSCFLWIVAVNLIVIALLSFYYAKEDCAIISCIIAWLILVFNR